MVTCTRCGVNLPRSEARTEDGKLVCASNPQCR
jgi:formylmethanofuran dehydrogenase subunit E